MADIKTSALAELTAPADGDMFSVDDISEAVTEKTKRILFSTLRKAALSDADGDTKITTDAAADEDIIRFYTGAGGQQIALADGSLTPAVDNDVDIGSTTKRFKIAAFVKYFITSTFYATLPTNGVSGDSKIMMGDSNTILWFYNNAAPPGWKVYATGDYAIRVGVTGGLTGGSWTISGLSNSNESAHTHNTDISHVHGYGSAQTTGTGYVIAEGAPAVGGEGGAPAVYIVTETSSGGSASKASGAGAAHVHTISADGAWRPAAYIGKLYQLDTP